MKTKQVTFFEALERMKSEDGIAYACRDGDLFSTGSCFRYVALQLERKEMGRWVTCVASFNELNSYNWYVEVAPMQHSLNYYVETCNVNVLLPSVWKGLYVRMTFEEIIEGGKHV